MPEGTCSKRSHRMLESDNRNQAKRIEALESALRRELDDTIEALPSAPRRLFEGNSPEDEENLRAWEREIAGKALELAEPKLGEEMNNRWYNGERAFCPFCGGSAAAIMQPDDTGFAYPEGLWMHLRGKHPATKCRIMTIAVRAAKAQLGVREWWK